MQNKNSEDQKNFSVTLDKGITRIPTYGLFLIRGTSDYMEIQLASRTESDTDINILIESIFRISKDAIPQFARQFSKYLQEYSEKQESQEPQDD